jgi:Peptidase A4 family
MPEQANARTSVRLRTYEPPPDGFDPRTAMPADLERYGFPHRPDPEREPELSRLWQDWLTRAPDPDIIKAELRAASVARAPRQPRTHGANFGPDGWGGIEVPLPNFGQGSSITVFGEWVVPEITPVPTDPATPLTVAFWVGFDGLNPNGYALFQGGIAATITGDAVQYWPFLEFSTDSGSPWQITNYDIQAGDTVSVLVWEKNEYSANISIMNYRTNQALSAGLWLFPVTGGLPFGDEVNAVWVVEGTSADLPDFGSIEFTNATATVDGAASNFSTPGTWLSNIVGNGGANLTGVQSLSANSAQVTWLNSA